MTDKLFINADDFGISHDVNLGISECFRKGIIHETSLIVNFPTVSEAVSIAVHEGFDGKVGLHLNLSEGYPLTEGIKDSSVCKENGTLNPMFWQSAKNRLFLDWRTTKLLKTECQTQIEVFLSYGFKPLKIDSHQHVHTNPSVFRILFPLIKEYGFERVRFSRNIPRRSITGIKKLYKEVLNKKIDFYNSKFCNKVSDRIKNFGSVSDVMTEMELEEGVPAITEIEVHPILQKNIIVDAMTLENLEKTIETI